MSRSYAMFPAMLALASMGIGISGYAGGEFEERMPSRFTQRPRMDVKFIDTPKAKGKRAKRRAKGKRS